MKRMSSLRLTEAPMPVALIFSFSLRNGSFLNARASLGGFRRASGHIARALRDRFDDVVIAGAAADVALEPVPDRRLVEVCAFAIDEVDRGHDHARGAEPALQPVIVLERLLHRMQVAVLGEPFDRGHVRPLAACREDGAGLDRLTVDVDDARAALRGVAADVRAGHPQVLAQELHEQRPRIDVAGNLPAVHRHRDMNHSHTLLIQDGCGRAAAGASTVGAPADTSPGAGAPSRAASANLAKNLSAMLLATPSTRREPSWAILPPTC